ncbi:MAG: hypothetical protein U1E76_22145 [Planctomycetota bacterium]
MNLSLINVYVACAAIGGTVLCIQTILLLVGGAGDHTDAHFHDGDVHDASSGHDHAGDGHGDLFIKLLTFKTVVAFLTFFGLGGLAASSAELDRGTALVLAVAAGAIALVGVAYLMAGLAQLQSRGNLNLKNAVGQPARVYLRVPAHAAGNGKVIVAFQGRKVECKAVTHGTEIPTGAEVKVIAASGPDTVEVVAIAKE